jgi:hypothetical protein
MVSSAYLWRPKEAGGEGLLAKTSSIFCMISGVILGSKVMALQLSSIWATLVAPRITVLTLGFITHLGKRQYVNESQSRWDMDVPGKRELCDSATELLGDLGKTSDLLDLGLALVTLESLDRALEEALVGGETAVLGDAVVVLAGKKTGSERRPDGGAVLVLVVERSILDLEALAVEGIVLRLLGDRSNEVVPAHVSGLVD